MASYTLAEMVLITGAERRMLQFMTDRGVIHAEKGTASAGRGVHRHYSRNEAIIACLVYPFAMRHMSVGELSNVADAVRRHLNTVPLSREVIENVIAKKTEGYLVITTVKSGDWGATIYEADPNREQNDVGVYTAIGAYATDLLHKNRHRGVMAHVVLLNNELAGLS